MESLTFQPVFSSWCTAILLWGGIAVTSFLLLKKTHRFSRSQKSFLFVFRFAFLCIFGLILLRPGIDSAVIEKLPASLAVLLDTSESMSISDMDDGKTRFQAAAETLKFHFDKNHPELPVSFYQFDESVHLMAGEGEPITVPENPEGKGTAVGLGLQSVLNQYTGKRLLGLILLSDGAERSDSGTLQPQEAALRYRNAGIPIFPMTFGSAEDAAARRDIALDTMNFPSRVFAGNEIAVTGNLRVTGCRGETFPLIFSAETDGKMVPVEELNITVDTDDQLVPFRFSCHAELPGELKLRLAVPVQKGELLAENNESDGYVQVEEGNLSVLFLEGKRRFEDKFIRMALDSTKEIEVDYRRFPDPDKQNQDNKNLDSDAEELNLKKYSVLILGDADPDDLGAGKMEKIREAVFEGLGLVFLAGEGSIAKGRLKGSPLEYLVPVFFPDSEEEADHYEEETFRVAPAEPFAADYLSLLSADLNKSQKIWESLPSLDSYIGGLELKEGSRAVLLGKNTQGTEFPILVTQIAGEGRVLLLLADDFWRWGMSGFRGEYQKFWRQIVFWASHADELKPGELRILKDVSVCRSGEPLEFRSLYCLADESNRQNFRIEGKVRKPSGKMESVSLEQNSEGWKGIFEQTDELGEYQIQIAVNEAGKESSRTARFSVYANHREFDEPAAVPGLMQNLADLSGGRTVRPDDLKQLLIELTQKRELIVNRVRTHRPLYDHWGIFAFAVLLLTAEWFLRKKWGMV